MWKFNRTTNKDISNELICRKLLNDNNVLGITIYGLVLIFIVSIITGV